MPLPSNLIEESLEEAGAEESFRKLAPKPPFFLGFEPDAWEVVTLNGKPRVLPIVGKLPIMPGAGNMRTVAPRERKSLVYEARVQEKQREGTVFVPAKDQYVPERFVPLHARKNREGYRYWIHVRENQGAPLTKRWCEVWDEWPIGPNNRALDSVRHQTLFNAWRAWLIDEELLAGPSKAVRRRLLAKAEHRLNRVLDGNYPDSKRRMMILRKTAEIQAVEEATGLQSETLAMYRLSQGEDVEMPQPEIEPELEPIDEAPAPLGQMFDDEDEDEGEE